MFDEKLADERVLAIHVLAENRGPGRLDIRSGDMTLEFPDGPIFDAGWRLRSRSQVPRGH